jgi:ankyrin repeat protein
MGTADERYLPALKFLLEHGANINQCSGKSGYVLHAACCKENASEVIKLLLDHGADLNARGGEYETAMQAAAFHGHLENVKLLLDLGADPMIKGGKYGSPLDAAMAPERKHYHVANFLTKHLQTLSA